MSDQPEHVLELGASSSSTPTSVVLAPVVERKCARRTRRKQRSTGGGFPTVTECTGKSVFARKATVTQLAAMQGDTKIKSEADRRIEGMSAADIQDALEEIHNKLSPEMIEFLRFRSKEARPHTKVDLDIRPDKSDADVHAITARCRDVQLEDSPNVAATGAEPSSIADDMDLLLHDGVPAECEKLEWTQDARLATEGQETVETMQQCKLFLGEAGSYRFDLNGKILSAKERATLPTHLGLHHHGVNPSDAGYTVTEVILLMRSANAAQRAMAFNVFAKIVQRNRELVFKPLLDSHAFALAFTKLSVADNNPAAAAAQLEVAEAVLGVQKSNVLSVERDLYLASLFYSAFAVGSTSGVVELLLSSDIVPIFLSFAHSWYMSKSYALCSRALQVCRLMVKSCNVATGGILLSKINIPHLLEIALSNSGFRPVFLACDIVSSLILFAGWGEVDPKISGSLYSDGTLRAISAHLQIYLHERKNWAETHQLAAAASVRVLRAALVFDSGIRVFRDCLPAVCAMCFSLLNAASKRLSDTVGVASREAFLALEAFVHAIFSLVSGVESNMNNGDEYAMDDERILFRSQISALVPVASFATKVLLEDDLQTRSDLKAAAGHFAGSVHTFHHESIAVNDVSNVLQLAKCGAEYLALQPTHSVVGNDSIASMAHAAARMLVKCPLPENEVADICRHLITAADYESKRLSSSLGSVRPVANAASEWLVKYSQLRPNAEAIFRAVQLIPQVAEPQIIIELVFKCIANPSLLETLNSQLTRSTAIECKELLTGLTLNALLSKQSIRAKGDDQANHGGLLTTFADIVKTWVSTSDTVEYGALIVETVLKSDILPASKLYQTLHFAPPPCFMHGTVLSRLVVSCGEKAYSERARVFDEAYTRSSTLSSHKRPPLAERILILSQALADRGPFVSAQDGAIDALASLVLAAMCHLDVHAQLRLQMWQNCVRDVGGAALFAHAQFFGNVESLKLQVEHESIMSEYCRTIADGLLEGMRCPSVLRNVIRTRIQASLQLKPGAGELGLLLACANDSSSRVDTAQWLSYTCSIP